MVAKSGRWILVCKCAAMAAMFVAFVGEAEAQSVSVSSDGAAPNANAVLDLQSPAAGDGKGFLAPRLTAAQRTTASAALAGGLLNDAGELRGGPAPALLVYQTDAPEGFYYNKSRAATPNWVYLGQSPGGVTSVAAAAPLTGGTITDSGVIGINKAGASTDGYLSQADWAAFNAKSDLTLGQTSTTAYPGDLGATVTSAQAAHADDTANPHDVTKAQVGLGNADNTSDAAKPISAATRTALDAEAAALASHEADTANPHDVTKAQVGLGNVADLKGNLAATAAPTATDDADKGYAVGSQWVDTAAGKYYVCVDAAVGVAVWCNTTASGGTVTSVTAATPLTGGEITTTGTIGIAKADAATDGYLSQADWAAFNAKSSLTLGQTSTTAYPGDLGATVTSAQAAHAADTANPHDVTKTQVGLGNADDTSDAAKPISAATQTALDAEAAALASHEADTANPHDVTASQVGLGNVDNTADADKPVSTATAAALATKLDTTAFTLPIRGSNVAVGDGADGDGDGAALGYYANANNAGAALGKAADAHYSGAAVGLHANGKEYGAALGYQTNADSEGAAVGHDANANNYGAALGALANVNTSTASTVDSTKSAIGYGAVNDQEGPSCVIRGSLYLTQAAGIFTRPDMNSAYSPLSIPSTLPVSGGDVAVGDNANAASDGAAVGVGANAAGYGVALGRQADANYAGAAIGYQSLASGSGAALGYQGNGFYGGAAAGYRANGSFHGAAVGSDAAADTEGAALGYQANGRSYAVALGYYANANVDTESTIDSPKIAIGYNTVNDQDGPSCVIRGNLYLTQATGIFTRPDMGSCYSPLSIPSTLPVSGCDVVVGDGAEAADNGAAVGVSANSSGYGAAFGYQADGSSYGAAVGYQAYGNTGGAALGYQANSYSYGVAIGQLSKGTSNGVALGYSANAETAGAAVGFQANANDVGVAVGGQSTGVTIGAAVGSNANGSDHGAALGYLANGSGYGMAAGLMSSGDTYGTAVGFQANGQSYAVALGSGADANNTHASSDTAPKTAIGYNAVNDQEGPSCVIRGSLYLTQATGIFTRPDMNSAYSPLSIPSTLPVSGTNVAVGTGANASGASAAVGQNANGSSDGVAVGYATNGANGVAVGYAANGVNSVAVGRYANGSNQGTAVGVTANASDNGVAVGFSSSGTAQGVVVGYSANANSYGVAVGFQAYGADYGAAAGRMARGSNFGAAVGCASAADTEGAALGSQANGSVYGVALGSGANANGTPSTLSAPKIAIGYQTSNDQTGPSCVIRGNLYLSQATGIYMRSTTSGAYTAFSPAASLPLAGSNVAVGDSANASGNGVAVGVSANAAQGGVAIGLMATGTSQGVAVGPGAQGGDTGAAVGCYSNAASFGAALGSQANAYNVGAGVGSQANGSNAGAAVGASANANTNGAALGYAANGLTSGSAVGYIANGYNYGAALGYAADGSNFGVALGTAASVNGQNYAVAKGYGSSCSRYNEEWKSGDGSMNKSGYGQAEWHGTTNLAIPTELYLGGNAPFRFTLQDNSVVTFTIHVAGLDTTAGNSYGARISGVVKRWYGTTTIVRQSLDWSSHEGLLITDPTLSTDGDAMTISVSGTFSGTCVWNATITYSEVRL